MEIHHKNHELKERTLRKIEYLLSKEEIFDLELYLIVKKFFSEFLKIDEELSISELIERLNHVYIEKDLLEEIVKFLKEIEVIEYIDEPLEKEDVRKYLIEFAKIVDKLIEDEEKNKNGEKSKIISEIVEASVKGVEELIEEIVKDLVKQDIKSAKEKYLKAYQIYEKLKEEDKAKVYERLEEIYKRLKNM